MKLPEFSYCPKCGGSLGYHTIKIQEPKRLQCQACQFIFFLDPKVAAGTIISHKGQILLLKRGIEPSYGKWVFPGGFVDRGEKLEDAAIRETQEECLITVAINRLLGVYSYAEYPVIIIVYVADLIRGEPAVGDETLEVKYFDPSHLPWDDLAFPSTNQALRDFLAQEEDSKI
ncbi:MAG: NUDIX hydrolase [Nitrospirae bacterium]|nr:NUDIX hydrolase [Nitrospirota bacterium]